MKNLEPDPTFVKEYVTLPQGNQPHLEIGLDNQ
jgi:hypothetical protein